MAIQFHPLPRELFTEAQRPHIDRLNLELRELFALEGAMRNPVQVRRSDLSIARRSEVQVDVSRITPSISSVVSGVSTVVGVPNLTFGTANAVGTTTSAVSVNSSVALFDTTVPAGVSTGAATGSATRAARRDHVHNHPVFSSGDLHTDLLPLSGIRDMTGELGTDVGTFRSDVASGGVGFLFNTTNSFSAGSIWRVSENSTAVMEGSFEGHWSFGASVLTTSILRVFKTFTGDNRASIIGVNASAQVLGSISGAGWAPSFKGGYFSLEVNPTSVAAVLSSARTFMGGDFVCTLGSSAGRLANASSLATGGHFQVAEAGNTLSNAWATAIAGDFEITGDWAAGLTNAYGVRSKAVSAGTNRWGVWASNKVHCDASDFIAATNAKGLVTKDTQSTPRFWRMYTEAAAGTTGGVTLAIDAAGALTTTRVGGATGTINIQIVDVGTAAPAT